MGSYFMFRSLEIRIEQIGAWIGLFLVALLINACTIRDEGPLEKAGREVDDTLSDATQKKKSVGDRVGESIRDLGDKIEDNS